MQRSPELEALLQDALSSNLAVRARAETVVLPLLQGLDAAASDAFLRALGGSIATASSGWVGVLSPTQQMAAVLARQWLLERKKHLQLRRPGAGEREVLLGATGIAMQGTGGFVSPPLAACIATLINVQCFSAAPCAWPGMTEELPTIFSPSAQCAILLAVVEEWDEYTELRKGILPCSLLLSKVLHHETEQAANCVGAMLEKVSNFLESATLYESGDDEGDEPDLNELYERTLQDWSTVLINVIPKFVEHEKQFNFRHFGAAIGLARVARQVVKESPSMELVRSCLELFEWFSSCKRPQVGTNEERIDNLGIMLECIQHVVHTKHFSTVMSIQYPNLVEFITGLTLQLMQLKELQVEGLNDDPLQFLASEENVHDEENSHRVAGLALIREIIFSRLQEKSHDAHTGMLIVCKQLSTILFEENQDSILLKEVAIFVACQIIPEYFPVEASTTTLMEHGFDAMRFAEYLEEILRMSSFVSINFSHADASRSSALIITLKARALWAAGRWTKFLFGMNIVGSGQVRRLLMKSAFKAILGPMQSQKPPKKGDGRKREFEGQESLSIQVFAFLSISRIVRDTHKLLPEAERENEKKMLGLCVFKMMQTLFPSLEEDEPIFIALDALKPLIKFLDEGSLLQVSLGLFNFLIKFRYKFSSDEMIADLSCDIVADLLHLLHWYQSSASIKISDQIIREVIGWLQRAQENFVRPPPVGSQEQQQQQNDILEKDLLLALHFIHDLGDRFWFHDLIDSCMSSILSLFLTHADTKISEASREDFHRICRLCLRTILLASSSLNLAPSASSESPSIARGKKTVIDSVALMEPLTMTPELYQLTCDFVSAALSSDPTFFLIIDTELAWLLLLRRPREQDYLRVSNVIQAALVRMNQIPLEPSLLAFLGNVLLLILRPGRTPTMIIPNQDGLLLAALQFLVENYIPNSGNTPNPFWSRKILDAGAACLLQQIKHLPPHAKAALILKEYLRQELDSFVTQTKDGDELLMSSSSTSSLILEKGSSGGGIGEEETTSLYEDENGFGGSTTTTFDLSELLDQGKIPKKGEGGTSSTSLLEESLDLESARELVRLAIDF